MEINNRQARRFRRWVVSLLTGASPVPRPAPDALSRLPDARALLAQPRMQGAFARLDALDEADRQHQRRQARERAEVQRLARLQGLSLHDLRELRRLERILHRIPSLGAQPSLALDG